METIIKTATTIFIFTGIDLYNSGNPEIVLSYLFDKDYRMDMSEEERELINWDNFNMKKYNEEFIPYIQELADEVARELDGIREIKVLNLKNPSEYNFRGDWCDLDVYMEEGWKDKVLKHADDILSDRDCIEFFNDNFESRSGFISFLPEDMEEYPKMIRQYEGGYADDRVVAVWLSLMYVFKNGRIAWENWDDILEKVMDNGNFKDVFVMPERCEEIH